MATKGTPGNVELGPGWLYVAAIGTTEPTLASAVLPSAWRPVGYTEDGSTFTHSTKTEPIPVAEEFDPVAYKTVERSGKLELKMAEATRLNLMLAVNLGAGAGSSNDATTVEPPDPGSEVRIMAVWDSLIAPDANNERWLFRQLLAGGDLAIPRKKAPAKTLLPVTFMLEKPSSAAPWKCFPGTTGLV